MPEKRAHSRKKRRYLIEIETPETVSTGFTYDLAPGALFVRSIRIPKLGSVISARLSLPDGTHFSLRGLVLRTYRAPGALSRLVPSGFAMRLVDVPADYTRLLGTL